MSPCKTHRYKEERDAGNDGAAKIKKSQLVKEGLGSYLMRV